MRTHDSARKRAHGTHGAVVNALLADEDMPTVRQYVVDTVFASKISHHEPHTGQA
jgi:hypothetical protein